MSEGQIGEAAVTTYEVCRPYRGLHTSYVNSTKGATLRVLKSPSRASVRSCAIVVQVWAGGDPRASLCFAFRSLGAQVW